MRLGQVPSIRFLGLAVFLFLSGGLLAAQAPQIPAVDGALGSCRADFTVKDGFDKPIYNAKIHVLIKYGFLNKRKRSSKWAPTATARPASRGCPICPKGLSNSPSRAVRSRKLSPMIHRKTATQNSTSRYPSIKP